MGGPKPQTLNPNNPHGLTRSIMFWNRFLRPESRNRLADKNNLSNVLEPFHSAREAKSTRWQKPFKDKSNTPTFTVQPQRRFFKLHATSNSLHEADPLLLCCTTGSSFAKQTPTPCKRPISCFPFWQVRWREFRRQRQIFQVFYLFCGHHMLLQLRIEWRLNGVGCCSCSCSNSPSHSIREQVFSIWDSGSKSHYKTKVQSCSNFRANSWQKKCFFPDEIIRAVSTSVGRSRAGMEKFWNSSSGLNKYLYLNPSPDSGPGLSKPSGSLPPGAEERIWTLSLGRNGGCEIWTHSLASSQ